MTQPPKAPWWRLPLCVAASGAIGGLITSYAQSGHLYLFPVGNYQDLAAILLGAVTVVVATFGGVVAIAAFWGFAQMKREAVRTATERAVPAASEAAIDELKEQIENGKVRDYILSEVERLMDAELKSDRIAKLIEERVDKIALGSAEDRLLDEGAEEREL